MGMVPIQISNPDFGRGPNLGRGPTRAGQTAGRAVRVVGKVLGITFLAYAGIMLFLPVWATAGSLVLAALRAVGSAGLPSSHEAGLSMVFGAIAGGAIGLLRRPGRKRREMIEETIKSVISADTLTEGQLAVTTVFVHVVLGIAVAWMISFLGAELFPFAGSMSPLVHGPLAVVWVGMGAGAGGGPGGSGELAMWAAFLIVIALLSVLVGVLLSGGAGALCRSAVLGSTEATGGALGILVAMALTRFWDQPLPWALPADPRAPAPPDPEAGKPRFSGDLGVYRAWLESQGIEPTSDALKLGLARYLDSDEFKADIRVTSRNRVGFPTMRSGQQLLGRLQAAAGNLGKSGPAEDSEAALSSCLDDFVAVADGRKQRRMREQQVQEVHAFLAARQWPPRLASAMQAIHGVDEPREQAQIEAELESKRATFGRLPAYLDAMAAWRPPPPPPPSPPPRRKRIPFRHPRWLLHAMLKTAWTGALVGVVEGLWTSLSSVVFR
jgi:hypothetical protein